MSEEMSNDPLAAISDRYGPVNAAKSLSQRLTTTEISELAYPEDTYGNDRFQMVLRLGKAIDRGELTACGTAAPPAYLTLQSVKHGPRQPLIDRVEFARFLTTMETIPSGGLAEWISQPGAAEAVQSRVPLGPEGGRIVKQPVPSLCGHPKVPGMDEAEARFWSEWEAVMATGMIPNKTHIREKIIADMWPKAPEYQRRSLDGTLKRRTHKKKIIQPDP